MPRRGATASTITPSWQTGRGTTGGRAGSISLYARVVPTHAVELTAAYLDHHVAATLKRRRITAATLVQKQNLAAVIHLCGAGAGERYARRRFRLVAGQRCGDHEVGAYLARLRAMQLVFVELDRG